MDENAAETRLSEIAEELKKGRSVQPVRVREFIGWFGARRRGFNIVERIRASLAAVDLETIPDFEEPYIDSEITFALATQDQDGGDGIDADDNRPRRFLSDPIWRVGRLRAARQGLVSVAPTDSLDTAVTKMLLGDFSQLPVLNGRSLKGAVTWNSIGMKLAFGAAEKIVKNFIVDAQEVSANTPLLRAIPDIVRNQFVLVKSQENEIIGIVTTSDLSEEFQEQAEPFLLLREIEHQIRRFLIDIGSMSDDDIQDWLARSNSYAAGDAAVTSRSVHDLSFGEYVRIIEQPDWWRGIRLPIDRAVIVNNLNKVREIRNSIMHFDPDTFDRDAEMSGMSPEVTDLRRMNAFFQRVLAIASPRDSAFQQRTSS